MQEKRTSGGKPTKRPRKNHPILLYLSLFIFTTVYTEGISQTSGHSQNPFPTHWSTIISDTGNKTKEKTRKKKPIFLLSLSLSVSLTHTHTHSDTHKIIYSLSIMIQNRSSQTSPEQSPSLSATKVSLPSGYAVLLSDLEIQVKN